MSEYGNPAGRDTEVAVVRAIYDAFERRDLEAALELMDPDIEIVLPGTQARAGRSEPYRGQAGVRQYFADVAQVWDELRVHPGHMRAAGGGVVVFGKITAREGGVPVSRRAIWTWRVRDGRATSIRADDLGEARPTGS